MASGPSVSAGIAALAMLLSSDVDVRMWTAAPAFDGTGGTPVAGGGYAPAVLTIDTPVAGTGGQIAKAPSLLPFVFVNMPVPSTSVVAISVHQHSTGDLVWLDDSWVSPVSWSAGESPLFDPGTFSVAFVPVS